MTGIFKKQTMAVSFICLSLMGAFTSCNKNDDPILPKGSSVEAVIDDDFKTIRMEWSEADSFCLYDGSSTFTFTRKGETATFVNEETPVTTNCCYAYYPANGVVSADKYAFTVNLPDPAGCGRGICCRGVYRLQRLNRNMERFPLPVRLQVLELRNPES